MADCSWWQKAILMPGCRPWEGFIQGETPTQTTYGTSQYSEQLGPFLPNNANEEFSDFASNVKEGVSRVSTNIARIFSNEQNSVSQAPSSRSWYDIFGKASDAASSANSALQSTLTKVIILVVIVAIGGLFAMSYVQAKGVQLAK